MALTKGLNPHDLSNLLAGPCRALEAPTTEAIPVHIDDIFKVEKADEYVPVGEWTDWGAMVEGAAYSRAIETAGYEIENTTGSVGESVTDVVRTVALNRGELTAEKLRDIEQAAKVEELNGTSERRPERKVKFGSIEFLDRRRIAIVGRRVVGQGGDVIETDGTVRGAFVVAVLYTCGFAGDTTQIGLAKGQLASAGINLRAFPEPGQSQGEETGFWIEEVPGTIGAS